MENYSGNHPRFSGISRQKYGGNKGDLRRSAPRDYEGPSRKSSPLNDQDLTNKEGQTQEQVMKVRKGSIDAAQKKLEAFRDKINGFKATSQDQADRINKQDSMNVAAYNKALKAHNFSADSINKVNKDLADKQNKAFEDLFIDK